MSLTPILRQFRIANFQLFLDGYRGLYRVHNACKLCQNVVARRVNYTAAKLLDDGSNHPLIYLQGLDSGSDC